MNCCICGVLPASTESSWTDGRSFVCSLCANKIFLQRLTNLKNVDSIYLPPQTAMDWAKPEADKTVVSLVPVVDIALDIIRKALNQKYDNPFLMNFRDTVVQYLYNEYDDFMDGEAFPEGKVQELFTGAVDKMITNFINRQDIYVGARETPLSIAVTILQKALAKDEGFRQGYVANIAMAFVDEFRKYAEESSNNEAADCVHEIANLAANRFLTEFIGQQGISDK